MPNVTVITGTRKGIGRELALYHLEKGETVYGCSRGEGSIDHENYHHYSLDVGDESAVVDMVRDISKKSKKVDVLLNNAGIASMNHILTTPAKTLQSIFSTNFFGTFFFLREVAKLMMRSSSGRIVNFATVATPLRLEGEAIYASSKAAIVNLTEIASRELAPFNITVNALGPTPVPTDLIRSVPKQKMDALLERQAVKRFGDIKDIINVLDFYLSPSSDFITGQTIYLGGVHH